MSKTLAAIGLATSIALTPVVLAPLAAMAQGAPGVVVKAGGVRPPTVMPASRVKASQCSSEAAAKGLKGKPRKKFIAECKKGVGSF